MPASFIRLPGLGGSNAQPGTRGGTAGGGFAITGIIGQADADPLPPSTGSIFAVAGGFCTGTAPSDPLGDPVFANDLEPSAA